MGKGKARAEKSENDTGRMHVGPADAGTSQLPHSQCNIPSRCAGPNRADRGTPTGRRSTIQCGAARRAACVHRAISRRVADSGPHGLDIPARSGGSFALGGRPCTQIAVGRRLGEGSGSRTVGSQREVAGADSCGTRNLEQQSDLAAAARICVRDAAGRRVRFRAATAPPGTAEQQVGINAPANREYSAGNGGAAGG